MKGKKLNFNIFRLLFQLSILGILLVLGYQYYIEMIYVDFEAYCPFGGLMALGSYIENSSLACSMTSEQISMGILLFIAIILFSKLFCAYICPVGTITEQITRLGQRLNLNFTPTGILDKALKSIKYILLCIVFYFTLETSELFCKTFDPFYAIASGFNSDVNIWTAIIAIATVVIGSFFIRMFWCKYACPLGALSNIFKFYWVFTILTLAYIVLLWLGVTIGLFWFVGFLALVGYIQELIERKVTRFQAVRVIKNEETCIDCKKCDKSCLQGINVSEYKAVNHVDCHLCGDCIAACPVKNTLGFNQTKRRLKWLPALITLVLILVGIYAGKQFELPTVNIYWGTEQQKETAETFTMDGLRNVKCYGSSMSFVEQMKQVPGTLGAATYVGKHRVKVLYNPETINAEQIKEAIFTPAKMLNLEPALNIDSLKCIELKVDNFFDSYDTYFMNILLSQHKDFTIYGYESMYGEPVKLKLFIDENAFVDLISLSKFIEQDEITFMEDGIEYSEDIDFEVASSKVTTEKISRVDFMQNMFISYDAKCNNHNNYSEEEIETLKVKIIGYLKNRQWGAHLRNDVARNDTGIVRVKTYYAVDYPVAEIDYVKTLTNADKVWENISKDTLSVTYTNGYVQELQNPFQFKHIRSNETITNSEKN